MHGNNLTNLVTSVIKHFNNSVDELNAQIKFVKRKSKLTAKAFLGSLVICCLSNPKASLEGMCSFAKMRGTRISKQGFHQRFTTDAVILMQKFFQKSIEQFKAENCDKFDLLKSFSSVEIIDSSTITLPESLKNIYHGSGQNGSEASIKIQTMYDYLQGQIYNLSFTEGCRNDQGYDGYLSKIKCGALYLFDLGYFKLQAFNTMQEKGAYFISKYFYATSFFDGKNRKIDLIKMLKKSGKRLTKEVWLGEKEKIKIRLIAARLPDERVNQRLRKLKENARKHGRMLTKQSRELAKWVICITNVPEEILNDEQVIMLYSLRWQIEIFFKLCKSEAGIDKISGKKTNRILCEIYAKLICIVMLLYLCYPLRWQKNCEISFIKAYKFLSAQAYEFFKAITSRYRLTNFLKSFFDLLYDFAYKDSPRRKRPLSYQRLIKSASDGVLI